MAMKCACGHRINRVRGAYADRCSHCRIQAALPSAVICACGTPVGKWRAGTGATQCSKCLETERGRLAWHVADVHATGLLDVSCPQCTSLLGWRTTQPSCCLCQGTRRVPFHVAAGLSVWGREDCTCDTCRLVRAQWPTTEMPEAAPDGSRVATFDSFRDAFARRKAAAV
jgi:hypothetical protein